MAGEWLKPYLPKTWADDNPWFLVIQLRKKETVFVIDVGRTGWTAEYEEYLRLPAYWELVEKSSLSAPFTMVVNEGEQPYYVCRVFGNSASPLKIRAYGIGKKRLDGHVDRLWIFPDGLICAGDDDARFGMLFLDETNRRLAEI